MLYDRTLSSAGLHHCHHPAQPLAQFLPIPKVNHDPGDAGINASKRHIFKEKLQLPARTKKSKPPQSVSRRRKRSQPERQKPARISKPAPRSRKPSREPRKDYNSRKHKERKEQGLCRCGQEAIPGQTRCPSCVVKHREWNRQNSEQRRRAKGAQPRPLINDAELEQVQQEIAAREDQGAKRTSKRARSEAYRQKKRQRQAQVRMKRKSLGLCVQCAKPGLESQTRCADCVLKHRQYGRRGRLKAKLAAK